VFVHPSAYNKLRTIEWIFMKFDMGNWLKCVNICEFWLKSDSDKGHYKNVFLHAAHKNHMNLLNIYQNEKYFEQKLWIKMKRFIPKTLFL
jgi:hypothetical protein